MSLLANTTSSHVEDKVETKMTFGMNPRSGLAYTVTIEQNLDHRTPLVRVNTIQEQPMRPSWPNQATSKI